MNNLENLLKSSWNFCKNKVKEYTLTTALALSAFGVGGCGDSGGSGNDSSLPTEFLASQDVMTDGGSFADINLQHYSPPFTEQLVLSTRDYTRRSFIQFNLSSIPADTEIDYAWFEFKTSVDENISIPSQINIDFSNVLSYWNEDTLTRNTEPTYASPCLGYYFSSFDEETWYNFYDATSLVQYWINNPSYNYGAMFEIDPEFGGGITGANVAFHSRDSGSANTPKLVIKYK